MISRTALSIALVVFGGFAATGAQERDGQAFPGVWKGTQRWSQSSRPPGVEPQPVTLTITEADGKLTGTLIPFFGGNDGVILTNIQIDGKRLRAGGILGEAQAVQQQGETAPFWKSDVQIAFTFTDAGSGRITGTADLKMNKVPWLKLQYALTREGARP